MFRSLVCQLGVAGLLCGLAGCGGGGIEPGIPKNAKVETGPMPGMPSLDTMKTETKTPKK